jgi:O-antigen/teichoic acid export membrane protein
MTLSGVLAYAFHVLAARALGPDAYGQVAVLWAAMFLVVVVAFRPLEQTTARAISDRLARGQEVQSVLRSVVLIYLVMLVAGAVLALAAWEITTSRLFLGNDAMTAALFGGIAGYGIAYVVRGVCAGARWFGGYSAILIVDAVVRLVVALPLLVVASTTCAGVACAAAGIAGALAPLLWSRGRLDVLRGGSSDGSRFEVRSALGFAAPAAVIAAADQVLINGGPLLVMLGDGTSTTAGVVFAATMLIRVPVYVFQGVAASLLPNLTNLQATDQRGAFRSTVARMVVVMACTSLVIAAAAAAFGPEAMRFLYGPEYEVPHLDLGLLGLGVGSYLAAATLSQGLLAIDRARSASVIWSLSACLFLASYWAFSGPALLRISAGFALATTAAAILLGVQLARCVRPTG